MDLAKYNLAEDAEAGASLHLYNPYSFDPEFPDDVDPLYSDEGEPVLIHLVGLDGPTGKQASARMVKAMNRRNSKKTSVKDLTEEELLAMAAQNESVQAQFYADLTTGWDNVVFEKPIEFSNGEAAKLYKKLPWVKDQIDRFLSKRSNFRQDSKKT